jgi:hypothetical protein
VPYISTFAQTGYIFPGTTFGRFAKHVALFSYTTGAIIPAGGPSAALAAASDTATTGTHRLAPPSASGASNPPWVSTVTSTQTLCVGILVRCLAALSLSLFRLWASQVGRVAKVMTTGCPAYRTGGAFGSWLVASYHWSDHHSSAGLGDYGRRMMADGGGGALAARFLANDRKRRTATKQLKTKIPAMLGL